MLPVVKMRIVMLTRSLLSLVGLVFIVVLFINSGLFTAETSSSAMNNNEGKANRKRFQQGNIKNETIVFIYANQRSGSSFLGEIFNNNTEAFYLYEPLLPFTTSCKNLNEERKTLLKDLVECNFRNIRNTYKKTFAITGYKDQGCLYNTLCFISHHVPLVNKYATRCKVMARRQNINDNSEPCGFPLRENYLSQICEESDIRVFKILRICSLRMLDEVYSYLETRGYNVFVIHLVRDPRATMSSRLAIKLDEIADNDLGQQTKELCDRYKMNIEYVDNMEAAHHSISPGSSAVTDNRYLRIRYEDLALNTIEQAEYIYRFIGKTLPSEVKKNLKESALTLDKLIEEVKEKVFRMVENKKLEGGFEKYNEIFDKVKDPFETVRDPGKVATKWRKVLTFEQLQTIQEYCKEPMEKFNYKMLHSRSEMLDFDIKNY